MGVGIWNFQNFKSEGRYDYYRPEGTNSHRMTA